MIANVKFHVTRCHAVTLYNSGTVAPAFNFTFVKISTVVINKNMTFFILD